MFITIIALFICLFSFSSCSPVVCDIIDVSATMIFDYESEEGAPKSRLAVFVQTENEAARTQDIIVRSKTSEYKWIIDNPILLNNTSDEWAGYTNLQSRNGEAFESGTYRVEYRTLSGESAETQFSVWYPKELKECDAKDVLSVLESEKYVEKVAVYNANGDMIFYGKQDDSVKDENAVKIRFPDGEIMRLCYADNRRRYVCFMPPVELGAKRRETQGLIDE